MKTDPANLIVPAIRNFSGSRDEMDHWKQDLKKNGWGGYILFGGTMENTANLTEELHNISGDRLLFCSDLERGTGQQFSGGTQLPPAMAFGAADDVNATYQLARGMAKEAMETGINCIFAPVLDLQLEPANPIIQERSFGTFSERVSRHGIAFEQGIRSTGCLAVAKHFPGHGRTLHDSHMQLPVVRASQEELEQDLIPFRECIKKGCRAVMAAHVAYPELDSPDLPATLSKQILTKLLRREMEFEGIVFSDALIMEAVKQKDPVEQAVHALKAGIDVLLYPDQPETLANSLRDRIDKGTLPRNLVREKIEKLASLSSFPEEPERSDSGSLKNESLKLAKQSITALGSNTKPPELVPETDFLLFITDNGDDPSGITLPGKLGFQKENIFHWDLQEQKRYPGKLPSDGTAWVALFSRTAGWKGTIGPSREQSREINKILDAYEQQVLLAFCSPTSLRNVNVPEHCFLLYGTDTICQKACASFVKERFPASGTLPVENFV